MEALTHTINFKLSFWYKIFKLSINFPPSCFNFIKWLLILFNLKIYTIWGINGKPIKSSGKLDLRFKDILK